MHDMKAGRCDGNGTAFCDITWHGAEVFNWPLNLESINYFNHWQGLLFIVCKIAFLMYQTVVTPLYQHLSWFSCISILFYFGVPLSFLLFMLQHRKSCQSLQHSLHFQNLCFKGPESPEESPRVRLNSLPGAKSTLKFNWSPRQRGNPIHIALVPYI